MKHSALSSLGSLDSGSLVHRFATECMSNFTSVPSVRQSVLDLYREYSDYCSLYEFNAIHMYVCKVSYRRFVFFVDYFLTETCHLNFKLSEFLRSDTATALRLSNNLYGVKRLYVIYFLSLVPLLQQLRLYSMCPLLVTSGYRSRLVNQAVGGRPYSRHLLLKAADITIPSRSRKTLTDIELFAKTLPFRYVHNYGTYLHVDIM